MSDSKTERLSPTVIADTAGLADVEREGIARIIDPVAFVDAEHYFDGDRNKVIADAKVRGALAKADAIIAAFAKPHDSGNAEEMRGGWIIGDGNGQRWRCWEAGFPYWTEDRSKATRYFDRRSAEEVHADDEDAWIVEPYALSAPKVGNAASPVPVIADREQQEDPTDGDWIERWQDLWEECPDAHETLEALRGRVERHMRWLAFSAQEHVVAVDREAVAQVIDPVAWEVGWLHSTVVPARKQRALAKADSIIALLSASPADEHVVGEWDSD